MIYTVFPIGEFAGEVPHDFDLYDVALKYGFENFGVYCKDFIIIIEEVI